MMNALDDLAVQEPKKNAIMKGVILVKWVPEGTTVNQHFDKEVLKKVTERVRKKRPQMRKNDFILHQDKAPAHSPLSVKQFLTNNHIINYTWPSSIFA